MNIALFLNKDLEANLSYNLLKEELSKHKLRIYYSESVGSAHKKPKDLLLLEYFEQRYFYENVTNLVRKKDIKTSFAFFDESFTTVPFIKCQNVNSDDFIKEMKDFEPDLFISIRFGKIFKDEIISIPKKGVLNLHSGILPDFRGIMGTLHAVKAGRKMVGCTLHYIPNGTIDTGAIIGIAEMKVDGNKSLFWHIANLYPMGCELILKGIKALVYQDKLPAEVPRTDIGNYYSVPTDKDFDQLKNLEFKVISARDYVDFIGQWVSKDLVDELHNELKISELISNTN
jgi:methionyl-tRNA formyltransferase